ncbi:HAD-IIB family hydrolase [Arthrobacter sp. R-11]|uniref:HAD-IIB family hydrolase n=1 Tax=Arthrobacter sp. R-11 TaxID=3404053 RepID=UPI003CEEF96C
MSPELNTGTPAAVTKAGTVRAVFLDVDGTYADYGVVPAGHVRAVQAAREAGHRVFLCTGRPVSMLPGAIRGAGFDGLVASAGAYVEVAGEVLVDRRFPADLAARTVATLDAHDAVYVLEAQESLHVAPAAEERLRAIIEEHFSQAPDGREVGSSAILGALERVPDLAKVPFSKVSVFDSPVPMQLLVEEIGDGIAVVENSIADEGRHAGELYQRGISKADGVAAAIAHLGISRENSIAVGDGENDLEMVAFAGIGVAIEGSSPELLALADRTAAPPQQEGLVAAFEELGLI